MSVGLNPLAAWSTVAPGAKVGPELPPPCNACAAPWAGPGAPPSAALAPSSAECAAFFRGLADVAIDEWLKTLPVGHGVEKKD